MCNFNNITGSKYIIELMSFFYLLSSPFLFVLGDDRVILYTRAIDDTGDALDV